jgi:methionine aminotransferase
MLAPRRDRLSAGLAQIGFKPLHAQGTYFLSADFSGLSDMADDDFCQWLVREVGVATVPISAFYQPREGVETPRSTIRFCFAKTDQEIDKALDLLAKTFS